MPKAPIPLPQGLRGVTSSPKTIERVKNLIYANNKLIFRPSVTSLSDGVGVCRGSGRFTDQSTGIEELYQVSGEKLIKIELVGGFPSVDLRPIDVSVTEISDIAGSAQCFIESSFEFMVVLVEGGDAYVFDSSLALVKQFKDGVDKYKASVSVTHDSGRFVFVPEDGSPFFWTNTGDATTIDADNFADAEQQTDPNRAVIERKGSIYVLGSRSTEQLTYDATRNVYIAQIGGSASVGYVGGLTKYGESFAFLGLGENGGFNFYMMGQEPQMIYNETVSEQLNNQYAIRDLENARGEFFTWKGVTILLFYLPDQTLVYYGDWGTWSTTGQDTWRINNIQQAYGYLWTGDAQSSTIGYLQDKGVDYGVENEWEIRTFLRDLPRTDFIISRIWALCSVGLSGEEDGKLTYRESQVLLQVSKDGYVFTQPAPRSLGRVGDFNREVVWGSPIIKAPNFCAIIVSGYGDALVNTDGLSYEV